MTNPCARTGVIYCKCVLYVKKNNLFKTNVLFDKHLLFPYKIYLYQKKGLEFALERDLPLAYFIYPLWKPKIDQFCLSSPAGKGLPRDFPIS